MLNQLGEVINEADEKGVVHVSLPTPEKTGVLMYLKGGAYYRYSPRQLDALLNRSDESVSDVEETEDQVDTSVTDVEESSKSLSTTTMVAVALLLSLTAFAAIQVYNSKHGATS